MRLDLGLDIARPHAGACQYPCGELLIQRREWTRHPGGQVDHKASAVLAMATSDVEGRANDVLGRLISRVAPQMEFGRHALSGLTEELEAAEPGAPIDAAIAWTDGHRVRLAFCGHHRFVMLRRGHAEYLPPPEGRVPGWSDIAMGPGDWFIMAVPATDAALAQGAILALARQGLDAKAVCRAATAQAVQADPLNHHAELASHILPS